MTYPPVRPRVILAIFAALALGSATSQVVFARGGPRPVTIPSALAHAGFVWMLFAALSFVATWTARRFPLERGRLAQAVPAHLAAFIVISMTHTALYEPFARLVLWPELAPGLAARLPGALVGNLRGDIYIYGMMVGAYYLYALGVRRREHAAPPPEYVTRIPLKDDGRVSFLETADVERIEADGDYVRLHGSFGSRLVRQSLTSLERQLDPRRFARVHRSTIVNLSRIGELQPYFHGEFVALLSSGAKVKVSRTYRAALTAALGVRT